MGSVLAIVIRAVSGHLIAKAGFTQVNERTGAVTLIQRFGGALSLNIHLTCMDAQMPRAQDVQERRICCFWTASMSPDPTTSDS